MLSTFFWENFIPKSILKLKNQHRAESVETMQGFYYFEKWIVEVGGTGAESVRTTGAN